jgi:hypothetical protein
VLGLSLVVNDADALRAILLARLLDDYAVRKGIQAREAAVDAYLADMDVRMRAELGEDYLTGADLSPDEQAALAAMRRAMATSMIRSWEINRSLHQTHGGRVIYQQFGPEPLDAYVAFLREAQRDGRFRINDPELGEAFWAFFEDAQRHDFYPEAEAAAAFLQPPWKIAEN